jgi:hypothetical protein
MLGMDSFVQHPGMDIDYAHGLAWPHGVIFQWDAKSTSYLDGPCTCLLERVAPQSFIYCKFSALKNILTS